MSILVQHKLKNTILTATTWDGYIHWYEALIIMIFAIPYYVIMFQSARISRFMKRKFEVEYGCCNRNISGAAGKDKMSLLLRNMLKNI